MMYCIIWPVVSVNVHTAHPASAYAIRCTNVMCAYSTYRRPHFVEIFVKMPERNHATPNLPSLSCTDTYGQHWTTWFAVFFRPGILCPPGHNQHRNRPISWYCVEAGILLTCLYSGEATFQMYYLLWCGSLNLKVSFNFKCRSRCWSDVQVNSFLKIQHGLWPWMQPP